MRRAGAGCTGPCCRQPRRQRRRGHAPCEGVGRGRTRPRPVQAREPGGALPRLPALLAALHMEHNPGQVHEPGCALPRPSWAASGAVCELLAALLLCAQVRQVRPSFCWRLWLAAHFIKVYVRWKCVRHLLLRTAVKLKSFCAMWSCPNVSSLLELARS